MSLRQLSFFFCYLIEKPGIFCRESPKTTFFSNLFPRVSGLGDPRWRRLRPETCLVGVAAILCHLGSPNPETLATRLILQLSCGSFSIFVSSNMICRTCMRICVLSVSYRNMFEIHLIAVKSKLSYIHAHQGKKPNRN